MSFPSKFPGLGIIGCEKLAGIYGVNEGIIDAKGTGVQRLFYNGFGKDLVHSATTLIKDGDTIYYGNRQENSAGHPLHLKPVNSEACGGYIFTDKFECGAFDKIDRAFAWGEANLGFETSIYNNTDERRILDVYAYVVLQPQENRTIFRDGSQIIAEGKDCNISVYFPEATDHTIVREGPTGFIYRLTGALLNGQNHTNPLKAESDVLCGLLIGRQVELPARGELALNWSMGFASESGAPKKVIDSQSTQKNSAGAQHYWNSYLTAGSRATSEGYSALDRANQVAIKSAMIDGFVPADLTGFYYADGLPCYYARDALMVARAFLLAGRIDESRQIITYLLALERKPSGEFFQRYNGVGQPSEGANNSVSRQLDSIGYLLWIVHAFKIVTGELLMPLADIVDLVRVIVNAEKSHGMVGPEGGVNEGVFGPAFIVSSNMCIYGGLKAASELLCTPSDIAEIQVTNEEILGGIESTFVVNHGYRYGYVTYHDDLVLKYDTPQYFGLLYGFEDTENMRKTHSFLLQNAVFGQHGIGYSEQEYHHGPWTFNTAACAQYAYKIGDFETYGAKLEWLVSHTNSYGLMPESFSADDKGQCYINPLVWGCAEVVSALHVTGLHK